MNPIHDILNAERSLNSHNIMNTSAFEQAALHAVKVLAWVVGSAVVPALLTLYSGNPYWLAFTPLINMAGAFLTKWSGIVKAQAAK